MDEIRSNFVKAAESETLSGYVHGFTVSSFVQMLELEDKTCTLTVRSKGRSGAMYFKKGVMLNAQTGDQEGEQAAYTMLTWDDAQLKLENTCHTKEKVIRSSLTRMILEASKRKDESGFKGGQGDELKQAIQLVKGHHFRNAHQHLAAYLKKNPKNSEAWLWYSRCLGSMDAIVASLKKCTLYASTDANIAEELNKVDLARPHIKNALIRRCPFCWSPLSRDADGCHYCRASLTISKALSQNATHVDSQLLIEAVTSYTDIVAKENNLKALFCLCLANCNLNKVQEALDLLNEAARANPDNQFLSDQLNILINKVATRLNCYENSAHDTAGPAVARRPVQGKRNTKKILVVDDSPTTRKVVVLTLKQKGYAIVEAQDGLEALSKIDEERPDLILLDIILPKMDGYRILSIVKENKELRDIPVIMLTSKDGIINKVKGKLAGSAAYLTKPFEPKELIETVHKHI